MQIAANSCALLTKAAADVANIVQLMSDISKAQGGNDLDLDDLQAVVDESKAKMALAVAGLTKTAGCKPTATR